MTAMKPETVRLSSKGQLVIPRGMREALNWEAGDELLIAFSGQGIMIQRKRQPTGKRFVDLIGSVPYDGPPVTDEELQAPVDDTADWEASEKRSR